MPGQEYQAPPLVLTKQLPYEWHFASERVCVSAT